jgi:hypothetical protein
VDYDLGRNGVAYYDEDTANYRLSTGKESTGNSGGVYRNDGVDIYKDPKRTENYYVGSIEDGEWLQYTVNVQQGGNYSLLFTVSSKTSEGMLSVMDDHKTIVKNIQIPNTNGYENWAQLSSSKINLSPGIHTFRIYIEKGGFNFESIQFLK